MGQATLDLPDPTQLAGVDAGPLSPEALASADDLLSQLAGDDIDRLLAEADADRPAAPQPPVQAIAPVLGAVPPSDGLADPQILPAIASPAQSMVPPAGDSAPASLPAAAQEIAQGEAATAAAIDAILGPAIDSAVQAVEKQTETPEPVTAAEAAAPAASLETAEKQMLDDAAAHVASIMDVPVAEAEPAAMEAGAERQALSEPLVLPQATGTSRNYLRPLVAVLELINSPMDFFSDDVREAMGKVAIVTTFNAAAVLVYVMVFRHPHH